MRSFGFPSCWPPLEKNRIWHALAKGCRTLSLAVLLLMWPHFCSQNCTQVQALVTGDAASTIILVKNIKSGFVSLGNFFIVGAIECAPGAMFTLATESTNLLLGHHTLTLPISFSHYLTTPCRFIEHSELP
jgi:hypothetical protein